MWCAWRLGACALLLLACSRPLPAGNGETTVTHTPICEASDPKQVVAPQRIELITSTQLLNMIRLVSDDVAKVIVDGGLFPVVDDLTVRFPPSRVEQYKSILDVESLSPFQNTALKVGDYVRDNFAAVTKCPAPATDACAASYLDVLATKAYRRRLTEDEKNRFATFYDTLRSQTVNDYQVTMTVEQATGFAIGALLLSPQALWRWELGGETSSSPPGVYLTDAEIASNLSFFLTDRPPDDSLIADAAAGTLRGRLAAHVDRLLATPAARDWLTHVMRAYFFLNQLPATIIDDAKFPIVGGGALYKDLEIESRMFLSDVMWNGKVTDLLTSRKAFLNSDLASMIYRVPVPAGATPSHFVETTLPADQRAGMLTNAGFLTTRARATGVSIVSRGVAVKSLFTCMENPAPPDSIADAPAISDATRRIDLETAQEQAAFRAKTPPCSACHPSFDPYGLALDAYDVIGRYRTVDDLGKPVDAHATLPAEAGGAEVDGAIELAEVLAKGDLFMNCMARSALQHALLDAAIELPLPARKQPGCATAGVANELRRSDSKSFTDLFRAVATSPAFVLRQVTP
jgi:hypothetical protein